MLLFKNRGEFKEKNKRRGPDKSKITCLIKPYWLNRADISEVDGFLLKSNRLIVPKSLQREMLCRIHEGHQGINKCRMRARVSVWWPGLSSEITNLVTLCEECIKERKNHKEPMISSTFPDRPWQKVAMDLFFLEKRWYLLATDHYSRYPEIALLDGLTANNIITHAKSIFARHGIPEIVYSDNGPQFLPYFQSAFSKFAEEWNFQHITSSPKYPQSNGFVEAAVKIIKRTMKKEEDRYLALLSYRSTPLENGFSPAELLFGRKIRSRLPVSFHLLQPKTVNCKELIIHENNQKNKQKKNYDRRHRVSPLPELPQNKRVWVTDLKEEGRIVSKSNTPRSYIVETAKGLRRRNRIHLIPMRGMLETIPQADELDTLISDIGPPDASALDEGSSNEDSSPDVREVPASPTLDENPTSKNTYRTRYGRLIRKPNRLNL